MNVLESKKVNYFILSFLIVGLFKCIGQEIDKEHITIEQIDNIRINEIQKKTKKGLFKEALELDFKLLESAKKLDYQEGITYAYFVAGKLLCNLGQFNEALKYMTLVKNSEYYRDCECKLLKAEISNLLGRIYLGLGYYSFGIEELNKGLGYLKKDTAQNRIAVLYINKAALLASIGEKDSALYSLKQAIKYDRSPMTYILMTRGYLTYKNDVDSAKYYLELSEKELDKSVSKYGESIILRCTAFYYDFIGDYEKALSYYHKSLEISLAINRNKEIVKTYRDLADIYSKTGEIKKSTNYYNKFSKLNDSINLNKNKIRDIAARELLKEKDQTYKIEKYKWVGISFSIFILVLGGGLISKKYRKVKQENILEEKDKEIKRINLISRQRLEEEKKLKLKLGKAENDLVALAKSNDESFLPHFRELYPELNNKLLKINPKLTKSDFSLLGMIWFNFSSKDIARYTFVQHKTVQTKKYRLRKKLDLPQGADLYYWLRDLDSGI